jgi:hypothetical protein
VGGVQVDFDALYDELIALAIERMNLEAFRAFADSAGHILRPATLEAFMLSEYAIADLSVTNASVFYELGVRDAMRRRDAVLMYPLGANLRDDILPSEPFFYQLSADGRPANVEVARRNLAERLERVGGVSAECSLLEAVDRSPVQPVGHDVTDVFRDCVRYSDQWKRRFQEARDARDLAALRAIEQELDVSETESGVVVDLFLSYRALKAWSEQIELVAKMSTPLERSRMVQEQFAMALNRAGQQQRATQILTGLIERRGPSSETYGLLGRVHKDQWEAAAASGDTNLAAGRLEEAINAYLNGFEKDWRDPYPGINAATLMEIREPPDERRKSILPLVVYAAERSIQSGSPDYWDHATLLEAAVLAQEREKSETALQDALAAVRETWEPETTARNLRIIYEARRRRDEDTRWENAIREQLELRAAT